MLYATHGHQRIPAIYTETCTNCGAVIPVRDVINIDAEHNSCPKCGEAYKVTGFEKWQQLGN